MTVTIVVSILVTMVIHFKSLITNIYQIVYCASKLLQVNSVMLQYQQMFFQGFHLEQSFYRYGFDKCNIVTDVQNKKLRYLEQYSPQVLQNIWKF